MEQFWELANRFPLTAGTLFTIVFVVFVRAPLSLLTNLIIRKMGWDTVDDAPRPLRPFIPWNPERLIPTTSEIKRVHARGKIGARGLEMAAERGWMTAEEASTLRSKTIERADLDESDRDAFALMRIIVRRSLANWKRVRGMRNLLSSFATQLGISEEWADITRDTGDRDNSTVLRHKLRTWVREHGT
ncbi:hypothetical protein D9V34_01265 [Mycetocola lacteus]|uniref:Uncharacterized protein n=1 Tax=Mycetocola lacteus TaxID=76637 RepID=A0A3L7AYE5_9MICO|nr:hypothetical protein [Mycetocola lacteus]RLP80873.1 hypothetical protein D9V34_13560 [Mycetocola lacteus]RLP84658.1 hypothetical protein D9V34_01265 [Mycetocola lacteus]